MTILKNKSIREQWLKKLLDPANDCYNLRAFVYNMFNVTLESNQWGVLRDLLDPAVRRMYLSMARQSGKTFILALYEALAVMFYEDMNVYLFAPNARTAGVSFEHFEGFIFKNPYDAYGGTILIDHFDRKKFQNGMDIRVITAAENSKIEGPTAHVIILDEAQDISPYKVTKSILPMGGGVEKELGGAKIIQCGVPGRVGSPFHKAFKNMYDEVTNPNGYRHYVYPWKKCPRLSPEFVKELKKDDPVAFDLNYNLLWNSSNVGMFITSDLFDTMILPHAGNSEEIDLEPILSSTTFPMYLAVDWAKYRDSTVITMGYPDENGKTVIVYWWELKGTDYHQQYAFIKEEILAHYNIQYTLVDKSSVGDALVDFMKNDGINVEGMNFDMHHKDELYKFFRSQIQQRLVAVPQSLRDRYRKKEFARFERQMLELVVEYRNSGIILVHASEENVHDDYPDSAALLVWACSHYIEPRAYFSD